VGTIYLSSRPGARFRYSNAGFMVLGAIIEKVSGENYFVYVREHIFKPAGMINTDAYELDQDIPNISGATLSSKHVTDGVSISPMAPNAECLRGGGRQMQSTERKREYSDGTSRKDSP
jgi:CubicO group peptidase (beta-lactamase class C family)